MKYGLRTPEVERFITSLSTIAEDDWAKSRRDFYSSPMSLPPGPDDAETWIARVEMARDDLSEAVTTARRDTRLAVEGLPWAEASKTSIAQHARATVGAMVVMDVVPFADIRVLFFPFMGTTAALPIRRA